MTLRRSVLLLALVALLVLFLGLALGWHLVGMDHAGEMAILGGCQVVLAAALLVLRPEGGEGRTPVPLAPLPGEGICTTPAAVQRPPPTGATVLLC